MPCYRCATRQDDPARGASPWKRGVVGGEQVLVCPECQRRPDWTADLDRCASCGSTALVRALGETTCRACGATGDPASGSAGAADDPVSRAGDGAAGPSAAEPAGLADEVAAAIDRVLHRPVDG